MPANLLDDFPTPICHTAVDGALTYCNRSWLDFTGLPLESQLGHGWAQSIHPEDHDGCLGVYDQAIIECKPFECEYRLRRWDGEYRWVLDIGRPFYNSKHHYSGYVRVCYDNTDRKLSSDSLHRLSKRMTNRPPGDRREVYFGRREEIGPALTALLIHLALMQSELPRDAADTQQHLKSALDLVQVAVEALWEPTDEAGSERPEVTGLNLALMRYCDEATNQFNTPINYSGVEIPRLNSDTSMAMMRLLQEGLACAHDYAQASRISVTLSHTSKLLQLTIEDNGNGLNFPPISAENTCIELNVRLHDILEHFTRLGGKVKPDYQPGRGGCLIGVLPV
jgi:PAS domain S-box-containing protein